MAYDMNGPEHHMVLEGRERLLLSGVVEVHRFDEETIVLTTALGELEIQGEGLHIEKLALEGGELRVDGRVSALIYGAEGEEERGFLRRLLGG